MYDTIEIGIRAHDLPAATPAELLACTKKLGISYVQLAPRKSFSQIPWSSSTFTPGLAAKIRKDLGDLRISVLGSYIDLLAEGDARAEQKAIFEQNMLFAKYLGAGVVGTETGMSDHSEADFQKVLQFVKELVRDAEKLGVIVAVEGVWCHTIHSPLVMKRLLDAIDSPNLMTIFDPVNFINTENYHQQDEIIKQPFMLYPEKIAAIHLKDFTVKDGGVVGARPGNGMLHTDLLLGCIKQYKPGLDIIIEEGSMDGFKAERDYVLRCAK